MPSQSTRPMTQGVLSVCLLSIACLWAGFVHAACSCFECLVGQPHGVMTASTGDAFDNVTDSVTGIEEEVPSSDFRVGDRWNRTATNLSTFSRGRPITVTWGFLRDGAAVRYNPPGDPPANNEPSNLIAMLDGSYGASPTGDFQDAPWFRLFEASFDRWSELSGVTYEYEAADGGAALDATSAPRGQRGVYADVRIGGRGLDGSSGSNTLAFNYFPDHGDMVIDTDNQSFYANRSRDSLRLRNVLMHEAGHGLGFNHLESSNSRQLMEPFISTAFDGPQIDDILAAHRNYGDVLEKGNGNDTPFTPTEIGELADGDTWVIGSDGRTLVVEPTQTDFVSIDGESDADYYSFTLSDPSTVSITLSQVGRTYNEGPQDGTQTSLNTSTLNDLELTLFSTLNRVGLLEEANGVPVGQLSEVLTDFVVDPAREYFVGVTGTVDNVQLYELQLSVTMIPEPSTLVLVAGVLGGLSGRRGINTGD